MRTSDFIRGRTPEKVREGCAELLLHVARGEQHLAGLTEDPIEAAKASYAAELLMSTYNRMRSLPIPEEKT